MFCHKVYTYDLSRKKPVGRILGSKAVDIVRSACFMFKNYVLSLPRVVQDIDCNKTQDP